MLLKSVIFCAILTGVIAGPAGGRGTSKCVSFCKESTKFGYQPETTYNYDYTTDISTSVIGGSSSESRIHLKAKAEISSVSSCELVLKLRNVEIEESEPDRAGSRRPIDGSQALSQELTRLPLRFSFQDGKIEHICAPEQDPVWVLNIKRGILSTLQNSMENFNDEQSVNEVDVSGRCLTTYQPTGNSWGGGISLQKTKDLTDCSHRHSQITALQSIPYTSNSPMQSIPLLKGKQECTQTIRNRRVEKVQCQEVHKFQPFDQQESGAQTVVTQTLVFSSETRRSVSGDDNTRMKKTSLLFQSQVPSEASESDIEHILSILGKLEEESVPEIRSEAPHHFIELVGNLRVINHAALKALFRKATGSVSKKYLLDAMPLVTSAPSLAFMRDLLFDGTLDDKHADNWLTSLAFIKNPTLDMISALTPLLNENSRNQALLGISSMLNSYCKTFTSCTDETTIQTTLDKIFSYLGTDCRSSDPEQLKRTIFALKAVGNAGRFPSVEPEGQAQLTLTRCLSDRNNPAEIRLAAIDAFRRMPCRLYDRSQILSLFANMHEDTEIRIKAYLISMKCADRQIIDIVKDTLYTDSVNQVGSFVWTHLTNLQETSSPDKQAVRELLSNDFLKNKFNTDARKYSRNYEGALYWEDWNLGGSSDANLIFTPDSFLPRSGMVNLTMHLFGESVNVLEFGARVKSLEQLLEPIFGPQGYFPDQTVNEALHSMRRSKRDVNNNQLERLGSIYDQAAKQQDSPRGSIYTRIFGHEVMYKNFELSNENNEPALVDEYGNDWMDLSNILKSLTTGNEIEYTKSTVLLDATYTVTTSAGIPLSLAVKSAATVGLVANGKIDLEKFWEKNILDIKGVLHPSAAVQVDGILSTQLGTGSIRAGVTLQNTLLTSTLVQGEVTVKGAKVIHASLAVPQDKQEIFKASSQVLILRPSGKEHVIEQGPSGVPKIQHKVCSPTNSEILGVQLCGEINVPDHFTFPLPTPAYVAVYLQKTDTFNSYEFDYRFNNENSETSVNFIFDTPGSRINRRLAANFQLDSFNGILDASIQTPSTSLRAEGKYSPSQKTVQVTLSALQEQILLVKAAMRQQGHRIEPNLLVKLYNRPLIEIDGVVDLMNIRDDNGKANFNLIMKHLTQNPVRLNGELNRSGEKYDTKLEIESYILTGNTRSQFRVRPGHFSTKSVTEYSWANSETKNIDVSAKVQTTKKGQLTRFSSQFNFAMSDAPDKNLDISWETKKSNGFCENSMKFSFGKSSWTGHSLYNNQMSKLQQDLTIQASLSAPRHNIDYNVDLTHKLNEQGMNCRFSGRTNPDNEVKAELDFVDESNGLVKKTLTSKVNWPGTEYSLRSELKELREQDFEWELIIVPNQATDMKATVNYKNGSNNKKLDHVIEFRARGFTSVPISGNAAFSASDKQSHVSGQLEIEGNEDYSGRWSTSLDYGIVKSNTRKLEGKLTLNDKKYTGEVNYRKTKAGERTLTFDLNCGRHIAIETMLKGDLPGPFDFSLTYYHDKDSHSNKFGFEGTVDIRSINLNIDYFGQQVIAAGSYGQSKFQFECQLWDNQRYAVLVEAPELTAHKFIFSALLATPIDGFRDVTLEVQHVYGSGSLNFELQGQLEQFATNFKLLGSTNKDECRLASSLDVTGMKSLEVFGRLVHTNQEKSIEITSKYGEQQRAIKVLLNYLNHGGFSTKLETTGCNYMPEINIQLTHQYYRTLNTNLQIEWVMPTDSDRRQIQFQLTGQKQPYNYRFTLTSPWKKWNNLQGGIAYTQERGTKEFLINLDGNLHEILPISFTSRCTGTSQNFQHETVLSWSKSNQNVKLSSHGRYISITNAAVTTKINVPGHHYQLIWTSKKDQKHQKFQADATYDRQHYATGLSWAAEPSTKHVEASVWYQNQNNPIFNLEFEHLRQAGAFKIHAMALEGEQVLMKFTTELKTTGPRQWNFKTIVDSSMETLPTLRITSVHSIENEGRDVQHKSEILVGKTAEMQRKFWDHSVNNDNDVHKAVAQFSLQGGRKFDGLLGLNDDKIELKGELNQDDNRGKKINLELKSTKFSPIQVEGEWLYSHHQYKASMSTSSNGNNVFAIKVDAQKTSSQITGNLEVDCSFGHHVLGSIVLNTEQNKLNIVLKEDKAQLIDLVVSAQVKPNEGFGKVTIQSEFFNLLLDPVHLEADYEFDNELKFTAKYRQVHNVKSITGSGIWSDDKKKAQLAYKGEQSGNLHLEITGMHKAEGSLVIDNESIFEGKAEYFYEKADYAFGQHTIKILVKTGETYEIVTTLGLDLNKFLFTTTTPIEGWRNLSLTGQMNFENPTKTLTITAAREEEKYVLNAEGHVNQKNGNILVEVQTPVQGFTKMEVKLGYNNKINKKSGELILNVETQQFLLKGELSPTTIVLQLETPLEIVRKASFFGQLDLSEMKKEIVVKAELNKDVYEAQGTLDMEKSGNKGTAKLSYVFGQESYGGELKYDLTQDYEANLAVTTSEAQHNIGGRLAMNKQGIEIEAKTPLAGYEKIKGKATYTAKKSHNQHQAVLQWDLNGETGQIELEAAIEEGQVTVNIQSSITGFENINAVAVYQPEGPEKLASIEGSIGKSKPFKISVGSKVQGKLFQIESKSSASASITIDIQIPLEQPENLNLSAEYKRQPSHRHSLTMSAQKNEEILTGGLSGQLTNDENTFQIKLKSDLSAPSFGVDKFDASSTIHKQTNNNGLSSLVAEADLNGEKHKIEATFQATTTSLDFQVKSTFRELCNFGLGGNFDVNNGRFQATLQLNDQQTTLKGQYLLNGIRNSKINIQFTSPLDGLETIQADAELRVQSSGTLLAAITFQDQRVRCGAKLEGTYENRRTLLGYLPESTDLKLTLTSPIRDYESMVTSLKYSLRHQPRVQLSLLRNTVEEIKGEFALNQNEFKLNLVSNLQVYSINTKNVITWNTNPPVLSMNVALELGQAKYRGSLKANIQGLRKGQILVESSIQNWEQLSAQWKIEGDLTAGNAVVSVNLGPRIGQKICRSTWRTSPDTNWESARLEIWMKNNENEKHEQGFSAQYSMTVGGNTAGSGKLTAAVTYIIGRQKQQLTFSTSIKRSSQSSTLDIAIQTPFGMIEQASLNGKIVVGQEISLDLTASLNKEIQLQTNVIVSVNQLASKIKWSFIAPSVGQPFNLNAGYDLRPVEKFIELSFTQNEYQMNIRADATVPQDSNEIELHMNVNSNVPLIEVSASGSLKAGYRIDSDETRHLSISVNSENIGKWQVIGAVRLAVEDFYAKLHITSPRPDIIPNLKSEINYTGNLRQGISSQASIQLDQYPELKAGFTVSKDKILASFNSGIRGFENLSLEAKIESGSGYAHKKFLVDIRAMGERVTLEGRLNIPSRNSMAAQGSLRLNSSWDKINNGDLQLNVQNDGNIQINGTWGDQQVAVRGRLQTERNVPWWKSASTEFSFETNSEEQLRISSSHIIGDKEYSFNFTLGENHIIESYIKFDENSEKILSANVQWDPSQVIKVFAEAAAGRFTASVETPWSSPMQANGMYSLTSSAQTAKGHFTYDGQRSSLEAHARSTNSGFESTLNVDVPALHQKLDANVIIKKVGENAFEGSVEMDMADRRLAIRGEVTENEKTIRGVKIAERIVKLSLNLPSQDYPNVNAEVTIQRPKNSLASLQVEGTIHLPIGVSKVAFGYEIPMNNDQQLGVRAMIDSPLVSDKPLEFLFSTEIVTAKNFKIRFQYENNDVELAWDTTLPQLNIETRAALPTLFPTHSPFNLKIDGSVDFPRQIQLKGSASCIKHSFGLDTSYVKVGNEINSKISIDAPTLVSGQHELRVKVEKHADSGRYLLDTTLVMGESTKTVVYQSELTLQQGLYSVSGKISGYYGNHFVQLGAKRIGENWQVEVNGESITILKGKRFSTVGKFQPTLHGFEVDIECQTQRSRHLGKIVFSMDSKRGQLTGKFESPTFKPVTTTVEWSVDDKALRGKVLAMIEDQRHQVIVNVNIQDLAAQLFLESFLIPGNTFNLQTKAIVRSNDVEILGDARVNGAQWRLEGTTRYNGARDMEAKLEIRTPFEDWDRFTIGGKFTTNELHAELYTPFKSFPNAMFTVSGIPLDLDQLSLENIQPLVVVGLPWVIYTTSATCKTPVKGNPGEFRISFEERKPKHEVIKKFEASLRVPSLDDLSLRMTNPVKVHFEATIPGRKVRTVKWELGGRLQWKTWAELNALGELNDKRVEFVSEIRNEQGNRRLSIELNTPFEKYERFAASVRFENYQKIGSGQSIFVEVQQPHWDLPMKLEIDYHYRFNGLVDMDGEINVAAPRFFVDFPPLTLRGQSKVTEGMYNGLVQGSWGDNRPMLTVEAGMTPDRLYATIEAVVSPTVSLYKTKARFELSRQEHDFGGQIEVEWQEEKIFLTELALSYPPEMLDAQINIKTPFEFLRSASVGLRLSPLGGKRETIMHKILNNLDISFGASYNDHKLIQIELVNMKEKRSLQIHNPLRPVSLTLTFEHVPGQKLRVITEACWNLRKALESTVGFELFLIQTSSTRNAALRLKAGSIGILEVLASHVSTSIKLEQEGKIRWQSSSQPEIQELGYILNFNDESKSRIQKKYDFLAQLDTPFRSVQVQADISTTDREWDRFLQMKWDIKRDETKRIGFRCKSERVSAWKSQSVKNTYTIIHSALPHGLTLVLEKTDKNAATQAVQVSIQVTPYPQDHLTFGMTKKGNEQNGDMDEQQSILLFVTHPATKLNTQIIAKTSKSGAGLGLSYVNIRGEEYLAQVTFSFDNSNALLELTTGKELSSVFRFELVRDDSRTLMIVRGVDNMQAELSIHTDRPFVELIAQYDAGKQLHLTGGLPHKKEISIKLWREEYGMNVQDLLVVLRLNTSQILSSKLIWRSELLDEVYEFGGRCNTVIQNCLGAIWTTAINKLGEELQGRWDMLQPDVRQTLENLGSFTVAEIEQIGQELSKIKQFLSHLHDNNCFYLKDLGTFFGVYLDGLQSAFDYVSTIARDAGLVSVNIARDAVLLVKSCAGELENVIIPLWTEAEKFVERMWREQFKMLSELVDLVQDSYETLMDAVEGRIEQLEKKILAVGFIRKAIRLYQDYTTWIEELPIQDYIDNIYDLMDKFVWQPMKMYYEPYFNAINNAIEEKNLLAILELPPLPYLRYVSNNVRSICGRVWGIIEAEQKIKFLVTKIFQSLDNLVHRNIPAYSLTWELEKGHIEYHQPLTILEWEDFTTLPKLRKTEADQHDINKMSDLYYEVVDTIRNVKPALDMNIRDILPPFGAHAVMAGDHHYYTFDKKYFRFAGECSYVLAADLLHQNFSLIVNYENRDGDIRKKSYTLVTGKNSVDIDTSNMKVTLDGRKVELPLEVGPTFIRRLSNGVEIFDTRGFQMTCNQSPAVCTLSISGWYFGKVAGLLGTYDNEEMNDMKTPEGQIVTDVANFAHSWRVGRNSGECRMKNLARDNAEMRDIEGTCSQIFDDKRSLLRPCFNRVDSTIFNEMCRYDTSHNVNKVSRTESACTAISAYVTECQKNGVDVWLPPTCIRCKLEDGATLMSGENATLSVNGDMKPQQSSDVVILLEESSCISPNSNSLTEVMRQLDNTLKAQGLPNNRYALLGYAGQGPHRKPHIHTSSGQIWAHSTLFKVPDSIVMNGDGHGDLYEAIGYASSTLKFRAGVSKTIIAITCGDENCGSESRYSDALTLLLENDFKLHLLTPKEFTLKGNKKDALTSKVLGIDIEGVYTSAHVRNPTLEADKSLRRQINLPKDLCTPLAIETNGTRFHLQRSTSKKSLDVWSRRVAKTAAPSDCQHCECVPDKSGSPNIVCSQCISPRLKQLFLEWQKYQSINDGDEETIPIELINQL